MSERPPLLFLFGLHLHQPVGNLDSVFRDHADQVYLPLLGHLSEREVGPFLLHVSGPLLDWLEGDAHPLVDVIGHLVADGRVELLSSGRDEPILAALDREDRVDQVARMRQRLHGRFGSSATTLWLTERVWEPSLAGDLAAAGVETVLLDDRHLHLAGLGESAAHRRWRTEDQGRGVWTLGIDEHLRYLVPFQPVEAIADRLAGYRAAGRRMALLADDGEKFGGWPGTRRWVWEEGWMERFTDTLRSLSDAGEIQLATVGDLEGRIDEGGPVYLPTASYREMEGWTLPPEAEERRAAAERRLEDAPAGERLWVRGGQWRNFLTRYPESNRMHKKAAALSRMCRAAGDPPEVRAAVGRAQCNDAYWHGVFGGLYVRPLRAAVWRNLAAAEGALRRNEGLEAEIVDLDGDGRREIWVHSSHFSAVVAPHRGGALEELTLFATGRNLLDVLTRRRESYHRRAVEQHGSPGEEPVAEGASGGSIHERERALRLDSLPDVDPVERVAFVEAVVDSEAVGFPSRVDPYGVEAMWWRADFDARVEQSENRLDIVLEARSPAPWLMKRYRFEASGRLEVELAWDGRAYTRGAELACALSSAWEVRLEPDPEPSAHTAERILTSSRTEQGWAHELQGHTQVLHWPVELGGATVVLDPAFRGASGEEE